MKTEQQLGSSIIVGYVERSEREEMKMERDGPDCRYRSLDEFGEILRERRRNLRKQSGGLNRNESFL